MISFRRTHIIFSSLSLFLASVFLFPTLSVAAEGSFMVRPAKVELSGKPGETLHAVITLGNQLGAPATFTVSYEDVAAGQNPEDSVTLLGEKRGPYPLRDLLRAPHTVSLVSGEEERVPVSVVIPADATPGGLYGSVIFTPVRTKGAGNVVPDSRIGVLFFVRVQGEAKESGKLSLFETFNNQHVWFGRPSITDPVHTQIVFENTGTVHLNPYGKMSIKAFGSDAVEVVVDPWYVLPGSTRMRENTLVQELSYGPNTIALELNRGYKDIVDDQTITIWVFPSAWVLVCGGGILLVLLWMVIRRVRKLHVV